MGFSFCCSGSDCAPERAASFYNRRGSRHGGCAGSRHIGHRLLSAGSFGQPLLVELIWGEIVERLVQAPGFVAAVPGEQGVLEPAEVSGQIVDVVELVV